MNTETNYLQGIAKNAFATVPNIYSNGFNSILLSSRYEGCNMRKLAMAAEPKVELLP